MADRWEVAARMSAPHAYATHADSQPSRYITSMSNGNGHDSFSHSSIEDSCPIIIHWQRLHGSHMLLAQFRPNQSLSRCNGRICIMLRPVPCERLRNQKRQDDCCIRTYLDWLGINLDLAPADCLIGPRPAVAAIELLGCVDIHRKVGAIAHQVRIADVMTHSVACPQETCTSRPPCTSLQDQNSGTFPAGLHGHSCARAPPPSRSIPVVNPAYILNNVDAQPRVLVAVEEEHVTDGAVGDGRAEDGNVVLPRPVRDAVGVVYDLAHACNHLCGCGMKGRGRGGCMVDGGQAWLQRRVAGEPEEHRWYHLGQVAAFKAPSKRNSQ
eukprot:91111-Chlamydomonas_euryale.AAC.6